MRSARKLILIGGTGLCLFAICILAYPHFWYRVGSGEAMTPKGRIGTLTIFKSTSEDLLFLYRDDSLQREYILDSSGDIGLPNGGQFIYFASVAFSRNVPAPTVSSKSTKIGFDMHIVENGGMIEFNIADDVRLNANRDQW